MHELILFSFVVKLRHWRFKCYILILSRFYKLMTCTYTNNIRSYSSAYGRTVQVMKSTFH